MRNISAVALNILTTKKGIEPLILVEVFWNGYNSTFYCDKAFPQFNIQGKIVELANLENVINVSGSSNSASVELKLDDTDGSIKAIYDICDIHKKKVVIYQWFSDIPFSDKFVLFVGQINTPIVWNGGDRTISFNVVSKLEDQDVGYSAEEGNYSYLPSSLIGQPWPLPFGTCPQVPPLQLDPIPTGTTTDGIGLIDEGLDHKKQDLFKQMRDLRAEIEKMYSDEFLQYLKDIQQHDQQYGVGGLIHDHEDFSSDPFGLEYVNKRQANLEDIARRAGAIELQIIDIVQQINELEQQREDMEARYRTSIGVHNGHEFPQGVAMSIMLGGQKFNGSFSGDTFNITSYVRAENLGVSGDSVEPVADSKESTKQLPGWLWIASGESVRVLDNLPLRYIVAMIPVTVLTVTAYRTRGLARVLTPVPSSYYGVSYQNYGNITATIITLVKPLSYYVDDDRTNQGWDDDIYIDMVSPIGPNTCDILAWLINTYSPGLGIDATSFFETRAAVDPFQSNFCLTERKNILTALQEIAYQARCAVWLKNDVFYFRYLPNEPSPVETISESDFVLGSLEIHHTDTESLITKLIAEYKVSYSQKSANKIILRNNVAKYGVHEQTTNWYIYLNPSPVDLAATFWIIRLSNTWKLIQFRTPLHKLRIETFDAVTINFTNNYASYGPVTGIVQGVEFDSSELELIFSVWLPVRLGEMTKYPFAWPIDSETIVYAPAEDTFAPGSQTGGDLKPISHVSLTSQDTSGNVPVNLESPRNHHSDGHPNPGTHDVDNSIIVVPKLDKTPEARPRFDNRGRQARNVPPVNTNLQNQDINRTLPGVVTGTGSQGAYKVNVYPQGRAGPAVATAVSPFDPTEIFQVGDFVNVHYVTFRKTDPRTRVETLTSFKYILGTSKPGVFRGEVLSGSGGTYQVKILVGTTEKTVTCTQLQIATGEAIPAGTMTLVGEYADSDGSKKYFMQVPVWLE